MKFDLIAPDNLHAVWDRVRDGLDRVRDVSPERWLPEDIFTHLRIGRAQLYAGFSDIAYLGFFIIESKRDPFTNEAYLNVWVLYAEPTTGDHFAGVEPFVRETMEFIDGLARKAGAQWIAMEGRMGWQRFLKEWFTPVKVKMERKVPHV